MKLWVESSKIQNPMSLVTRAWDSPQPLQASVMGNGKAPTYLFPAGQEKDRNDEIMSAKSNTAFIFSSTT